MVTHNSVATALDPARTGALRSWFCEQERGGSVALIFGGLDAAKFSVSDTGELVVERLDRQTVDALAGRIRAEFRLVQQCLRDFDVLAGPPA
jgi:hypothetical protein